MEITFARLDKLQLLINLEKNKYKQAIESNQQFEIIKSICYSLLKLEAEVSMLMEEINARYLKNVSERYYGRL